VLLGDEPPVPRALVDAAREAIKDNRTPSSAGRRFWELSGGGILRCALCGGRMAPHSWAKPSGRRYYYYRCVERWQHGTCGHNKTHNAKDLEERVWGSVRVLLSDPEVLRADLDRMIEMKANALRMGDALHGMNTWLEKLAEADNKAVMFQHAYAENAITLDDLRARLTELEELRETANGELERLRHHEDEIAELERDRDALLAHYEVMAPEALDALTPEERRNLYTLLRLEVRLSLDGSLELRGAAIPEGLTSVCEVDTSRG
jgi:recombinase-like zinc beta ribbon protein